jgi:hypothetical protein
LEHMARGDNPLFSQRHLDEVLRGCQRQMQQEIDGVDGDALLNASVDDLCGYLEEKYGVSVPVLDVDRITQDHSEAQIDVSRDPMRHVLDRSRPAYVTGTRVTFYVPFQGDPAMFNCTSSTYTTVFPYGRISGNELLLTYESLEQSHTAAKSYLDHNIGQIERWLGWIRGDVSRHNASLRQLARARVEARREKLLRDRAMVEAIGIPMRKRGDAPRTYVVPTVRRENPVKRPTASAVPYAPEPVLDEREYEHILTVISSMATVIEQSPDAFREMGEEDLRTHFLVQLNGQYEGQATGETFNFQGKTDILVKRDGKNVFIAECKFWSGPQSLGKALDQLLGYAAWRDTKTALLVFNRQKDFSTVLGKIPDVVRGHPNFKRQLSRGKSRTESRFVLHHPGDQNRELMLTVLAFDTPQ